MMWERNVQYGRGENAAVTTMAGSSTAFLKKMAAGMEVRLCRWRKCVLYVNI